MNIFLKRIGKFCLQCASENIDNTGLCRNCGAVDRGTEGLASLLAAKLLQCPFNHAKRAAEIVAAAFAAIENQKANAGLNHMLGMKSDGSTVNTDGDGTDIDNSGQGEMCPECGEERIDSTGTCPNCGHVLTEVERENIALNKLLGIDTDEKKTINSEYRNTVSKANRELWLK